MTCGLLLRWFTLFAALLAAGQAHAIRISAGDSWTVSWTKQATARNGLAADLTVTSQWLVSNYSRNALTIDISISNNAVLGGSLQRADVRAIGMLTPRYAHSSLATAGTTFDRNLSAGWLHMMYGSNGGLQAGDSDSLQLTLNGRFGRYVDLMLFPMKIKLNNRQYVMNGAATVQPNCATRTGMAGCQSTPVAEPPVAMLLLIGLAAMLTIRRLAPAGLPRARRAALPGRNELAG